MSGLTCVPALGFQTDGYNALDFYEAQYRNYYKSSLEKIISDNKDLIFIKFGKPTHAMVKNCFNNAVNICVLRDLDNANSMNLKGYIPVYGCKVGFDRIRKVVRLDSKDFPNKWAHFVRGCIELLGLGFLLAIPDLVITSCCRGGISDVYVFKKK